jgi:hypothetical protein
MKLEDTSKIVSIISVIFGILASTAAFLKNSEAQALESQLKELDSINKRIDISKKAYDTSSRLTAKFELPLARSFAEQYMDKANTSESVKFSILTIELSKELQKTIPQWKSRKGLMTGKPCEQEGLNARQVITILIKNIGFADASEVSVTAISKASPYADPTKGWQQASAEKTPIAYYDLHAVKNGWTTITFPVEDLHGQSSPEEDRNEIQVVLASVSGTTTLFGTVLVPLEISWTDKMTNTRHRQPILDSQIAKVRSALLGAEIGSLRSACN